MEFAGVLFFIILGFVLGMIVIGRSHRDVPIDAVLFTPDEEIAIRFFDELYVIVPVGIDERYIMNRKTKRLIAMVDENGDICPMPTLTKAKT